MSDNGQTDISEQIEAVLRELRFLSRKISTFLVHVFGQPMGWTLVLWNPDDPTETQVVSNAEDEPTRTALDTARDQYDDPDKSSIITPDD